MGLFDNILLGVSYVGYGWRVLRLPGIRRFVIIPLLVNVVLFSVSIAIGYYWMENHLAPWVGALPSWLLWMEWLLLPIFWLVAILAWYFGFTLIANLLAAPFNALLSERVLGCLESQPDTDRMQNRAGIVDIEYLLNRYDETKPLDTKQSSQNSTLSINLVLRTVYSELRKLLYQLKWLIFLLLISVIPGVNIIAPFAWAWFGVRMLALEYIDYPMSNRGLMFPENVHALKKDKGTAAGFGGGVMFMTMLPIINFFAMPVAVAGATCYWFSRLR